MSLRQATVPKGSSTPEEGKFGEVSDGQGVEIRRRIYIIIGFQKNERILFHASDAILSIHTFFNLFRLYSVQMCATYVDVEFP